MQPIYVSFYTPNYAPDAAELIRTLDEFGLPHCVEFVKSQGDWNANTHYKTTFLLRMMERFPGRPLIWVDADARIKKTPVFFDTLHGCDFAAHWKGGTEMLAGTMYWGPTPSAKRLLEMWADAIKANLSKSDQPALHRLVEPPPPWLILAKLPPAYTAIFDAAMVPVGEEVILHTQASRRLRNLDQ